MKLRQLLAVSILALASSATFAGEDNAMPANANPEAVLPSGVATPPQTTMTTTPVNANVVAPNSMPAPNVDCVITDQLADNGTAAYAQDRFDVKTLAFYYVCSSNDAKAGQVLTGVWTAVNTRDIMPNNQMLSSTVETAAADAGPSTPWIATFKVEMPPKGWPVGEYKIDLYYNNQIIKSQNLTVTFNTQAW